MWSNIAIFTHYMKRYTISLVLSLALLTFSLSNAQEARLSYKLTPGETYLLDIDLQQDTQTESINSEEISLYSLTKIEFKIDSINGANLIYMTAKYKDLLVSMLAPRMNIDINSSSGGNEMLYDMVNFLEQSTFQLVMSTAGELKSMDGLVQLFSSLASHPVTDTMEQEVIMKTLEEVYGPDSFKSMFNLFLWVYPVIQPMSSWTNDMTYFFNTKPVKMTNRYSLTKNTNERLVIQGLGELNATKEYHEITNMGEVKSTVSGSQTFDFLMNRETGWMNRCVSRQRVMIETTIVRSEYFPAGLKIPSYTETVFEVRGSRVQD